MTTRDESESWLVWSLRDAREKVAAWPDWKKEAMRVLPEPKSEAADGAAAGASESGARARCEGDTE